MEQYVWMAIGCVIVGFFANTYWDVYRAYRRYLAMPPTDRRNELLSAPAARPQAAQPSGFGWLIAKADRFLHALLMSPISR